MTFQTARANEIAKLTEAIAHYYAQGIDPPHYLTSQLADLDPYDNAGDTSSNQAAKISFDFVEFADTWNIETPTISYPQVMITVTEMQGYILNTPLFNPITEIEFKVQGVVVKFFAMNQPVQVKGYAIAY